MANIVGNKVKKLSTTEQTKLLNLVLNEVIASGIFPGYLTAINALDTEKDSICLDLGDNNIKTAEYIDGSYDAEINFNLIVRRFNIDDNERSEVFDKINEFGDYVSDRALEVSEGYEFDCLEQTTQPNTIYRDESGTEDNAAAFIIKYTKL